MQFESTAFHSFTCSEHTRHCVNDKEIRQNNKEEIKEIIKKPQRHKVQFVDVTVDDFLFPMLFVVSLESLVVALGSAPMAAAASTRNS